MAGEIAAAALSAFQFHKGAIRTIKKSFQNRDFSTLFQFHKGAIRTEQAGLNPNLMMKFQFHKGAIRTL